MAMLTRSDSRDVARAMLTRGGCVGVVSSTPSRTGSVSVAPDRAGARARPALAGDGDS